MISISPGGVDRLGAETHSVRHAHQPARRRRLAAILLILLVATISFASIVGVIDATKKQRALERQLVQVRGSWLTLQALVDSESAVRAYVLTGRPTYLQSYYASLGFLQTTAQPTLADVDAANLSPAGSSGVNPHPISGRLATEIQLWDDVIDTAATGERSAAIAKLQSSEDASVMEKVRDAIDDYVERHQEAWQRRHAALNLEQQLLLTATAAGGLLTILILIYALLRSEQEATQRETAVSAAVHAREQAIASREEVRQVFGMAEALQSAAGMMDGAAILRSSAVRLLPALGGALYVFNHLRDRLELVLAWDSAESEAEPVQQAVFAPAFLIPAECWALKRSKPHLNSQGPDALRCPHAPIGAASLEVPMVGRGESVGLLVLTATQSDGADRLLRASDIASVLADSMSLALSSIMLREKLRNQAVRDSLTGLYNRRFLEEVLQKLCLQAQRRHSALSAIMVDLDHFKRLNDDHGHAMGDTVLKAAAAVLTGSLRASDVACRYGGEELVVLMPDCTIEMARAKAEQIRERIARLSREGGPQVSASLGVSAMPSSARGSEDLLATADTAMYLAKQQGRNRVMTAPLLAPAPEAPGRDLHEWQGAITLAPLDPSSLPLPLTSQDRRAPRASSPV